MKLPLLLAFSLLATGCGTVAERLGSDAAPDAGQVYEGAAVVLESPEHGPELCLSGVEESYPPQCAGVPLLGWDWAAVDAEESANGTTWGSYRVVGTYDGEQIVVREVGPGEPGGRPSAWTRSARRAQPRFASVDETRGVVELGVVAATDAQHDALTERYGEGVGELQPALVVQAGQAGREREPVA